MGDLLEYLFVFWLALPALLLAIKYARKIPAASDSQQRVVLILWVVWALAIVVFVAVSYKYVWAKYILSA